MVHEDLQHEIASLGEFGESFHLSSLISFLTVVCVKEAYFLFRGTCHLQALLICLSVADSRMLVGHGFKLIFHWKYCQFY